MDLSNHGVDPANAVSVVMVQLGVGVAAEGALAPYTAPSCFDRNHWHGTQIALKLEYSEVRSEPRGKCRRFQDGRASNSPTVVPEHVGNIGICSILR
jgi:hypothetical protein